MQWVLVVFIGAVLCLGLSTVSFAQDENNSAAPADEAVVEAPADEVAAEPVEEDGCTQEEIKDPENTDCMPAGDAANGRNLFTGEQTFAKKGAPCVSCHHVTDTLSWGGGTLGPDLTGIVGRVTEDGVAGILSSLSFPSMAKVYETKQLNKQEQADLKAFFVDANTKSASSFSSILIWWGIGGFIVLLILQNIFWSGRFKGVRKQQIGGGN